MTQVLMSLGHFLILSVCADEESFKHLELAVSFVDERKF